MGKFWGLIVVVTVITMLLFWIPAHVIASIIGDETGNTMGKVVYFALLVVFFLQGIKVFRVNPPIRWIPTLLNKYIDEHITFGSGVYFLPFAGGLFGWVAYNSAKQPLEVSVTERTPADNSKVTIGAYFIYTLDPKNAAAFFLAGDKSVVEEQIVDRIKTNFRSYIRSEKFGPPTYQLAQDSNGLATDYLIQLFFPEQIPEIPDAVLRAIPGSKKITTAMFIQFFTQMPELPDSADARNDPVLKQRQAAAKKTLDELENNDPATFQALKQAIDKRLAFVQSVKSGRCKLPIIELGIQVHQLGIGDISPDGATAAGADRIVLANQDREVQEIEALQYKREIEEMAASMNGDIPGATEAVNLRRKLLTKTANQNQFALRADNLQAASSIVQPLITALANLITAKGNPNNP